MSLDPISTANTIGAGFSLFDQLKRPFRWWKARRYPKPPLGHFGIVIGITTENDIQRAQLKRDFTATLQNHLEADSKLAVLELSEVLSAKIKADRDAPKVLKKTESVFLIFGQLRRRQVDKRDTFVLDSKSAVSHNPITQEVQTVLAQEMSELMPVRRLISANNDLLEFELNAVTMDLAARYFIATAAYLSQQRALALELWKNLRTHLNQIDLRPLNESAKSLISRLKEKVTANIVTYHLDEASLSQYQWRVLRDISFLETMRRHLDAAESYRPKLYQAGILRALYSFVVKRNVKESRRILMEFSSIGDRDATWAFDMAFFYAHEGKLTQASGFYKKAFGLTPDPRLLVEIEEWLLWMLSEEPDKVQFHYCIGLINYFGKQDFVKAKHDFEAFLQATEGKYQRQRQAVDRYLENIENKGELLWDD